MTGVGATKDPIIYFCVMHIKDITKWYDSSNHACIWQVSDKPKYEHDIQ